MLLKLYRRWRRKRVRAQPFPPAWQEIIDRNVPLYAQLSPERQDILRGHVQVLLDEKNFEGCGGLELTDEMRVTIAAHAALLILREDSEMYPGLASILVYPDAYRASPGHVRGRSDIVSEHGTDVLGQSWSGGTLILAWSPSMSGARNADDGHNVILHEFAHQLDTQDGNADGTPPLSGKTAYAAWAKALEPEYEALRKTPHKSVLDRYGATNPAEFFAVATEAYFEKPKQLARHHPELFEALEKFYGLERAERSSSTKAR